MKKNILYSFLIAIFTLVSVTAPLGSAPKAEASGPTQKMILLGGSNYNDVWASNGNGTQWTQLVAPPFSPATWSGRSGHAALYFNNKIYVIGGNSSGNYLNDVWSSPDGIIWTQLTANAGFSLRANFASYVFNGKMWIVGGAGSTGSGSPVGIYSDVWSSSDGITWTQELTNSPFGNRFKMQGVVFQNKMWLFGGSTANGLVNDVWSSTNGINWIQVTPHASWAARSKFSVGVFQSKMWIMGGDTGSSLTNDVWRSTNGNSWVQAASNPAWSARQFASTAVFHGRIYVLAGNAGLGNMNDVYDSTYGTSWNQITASAPWAARNGQAVVVVPASFGTGTPTGINTITMDNISTIRAVIEIYNIANGNYGGSADNTCGVGVWADVASNPSQPLAMLTNIANYPVGTSLECHSNGTSWAVAASLFPNGAICADSTGFLGQGPLGGSQNYTTSGGSTPNLIGAFPLPLTSATATVCQ